MVSRKEAGLSLLEVAIDTCDALSDIHLSRRHHLPLQLPIVISPMHALIRSPSTPPNPSSLSFLVSSACTFFPVYLKLLADCVTGR